MQTDQFWGAHAAGVLHSAAGRMFRSKMTSNLVHEKIPCEFTLRPMNDEVFKATSERVRPEGMSRRVFLRATLVRRSVAFGGQSGHALCGCIRKR